MHDVGAIQGAVRLPAEPATGQASAGARQARPEKPETATPRTQPPSPVPDDQKTAELARQVREQLQERLEGHEVEMRAGENGQSWVIQIKDRSSGDVVFQIPPEQLVQLNERLKEMLKDTGLLVDNNL